MNDNERFAETLIRIAHSIEKGNIKDFRITMNDVLGSLVHHGMTFDTGEITRKVKLEFSYTPHKPGQLEIPINKRTQDLIIEFQRFVEDEVAG